MTVPAGSRHGVRLSKAMLRGIIAAASLASAAAFAPMPSGQNQLGAAHRQAVCGLELRHSGFSLRMAKANELAGNSLPPGEREEIAAELADLLASGVVQVWRKDMAPPEALAGGARGAGHNLKSSRTHSEPLEIYVVGTSHISSQSAADVERVIRAVLLCVLWGAGQCVHECVCVRMRVRVYLYVYACFHRCDRTMSLWNCVGVGRG
jgi:hypothetical protein